MTTRTHALTSLCGLLLIGSGVLALAQGAPPGAGPGGGGPTARVEKTAQEKAAQQVLVNFGALLDQGNVDEAFEKYVSKSFNDHSDMLRNMVKKPKVGYADAESMFKRMGEMGGSKGQKVPFVQQVSADDNIVTVKGRVGQDIYRVENGKITDHWDTLGGFTGGGPGAGGPPGGGAGGPGGPGGPQ